MNDLNEIKNFGPYMVKIMNLIEYIQGKTYWNQITGQSKRN